MDRLGRGDIARALDALAQALPQGRPRIEMFLVGGAALSLLYDARATTKDVDAVFAPGADLFALRGAAARVAAAMGLPADWLNDAAKGYLQGLAVGAVLLDTTTLLVRAVAPAQLLAMKLSAWRDDVDIADARLLLSKLAGDRGSVWTTIEAHLVPGRELKARYAFDDIWEADRGDS